MLENPKLSASAASAACTRQGTGALVAVWLVASLRRERGVNVGKVHRLFSKEDVCFACSTQMTMCFLDKWSAPPAVLKLSYKTINVILKKGRENEKTWVVFRRFGSLAPT